MTAAALGIFDRLTTVTRPEIIAFFAAIAGGAAGVAAAQGACDAIVERYSGRAVAIFLWIAVAACVAFEIIDTVPHWGQIVVAAQLLTYAVMTWECFWKAPPKA